MSLSRAQEKNGVMSKLATLVTCNDRQRLGTMLQRAYAVAFDPRDQVQRFEMKLDHAHAVDEGDIPPDVVTMHSTVEIIDLESDELETYTLVYPEEADIVRNRISILAPLGQAIFGHAVGELVTVATPSGERWIKIAALCFQPERDSHRSSGTDAHSRDARGHGRVAKPDGRQEHHGITS
jgi:regulator of nucleoside diphosphate kinase